MGRFIFSLILIFICLPGVALAQMDSAMIQIWFEESLEGGNLTLSVNFLSEAEELIVLEYAFEAYREANDSKEKLDFSKGEFLAVQNLPIPLATTTINLGKSDPLKFKIRIFQVDQLITSREFIWETPEQISTRANVDPVDIQSPEPQEITDKTITVKPLKNQPKVKDLGSSFGDAIEIQGLIIDETRSKLGRDFYEIFFRKWIPPQNVGDDFIIKIKELPSFGRFARVILEVNDQPLTQRSLSPRFEIIELQVNASIREARSFLSAKLRLSNDLENEDSKGSGIY